MTTMTTRRALEFEARPHPGRRTRSEREAILDDPGFGLNFTDHMAVATWTLADGWHDSALVPYGPFALDPATAVLHYAQESLRGTEGLPARRRQRLAVPAREERRAVRPVRPPAGAARAGHRGLPGQYGGPGRHRSELGAGGRREEPVPAAVHVRLRGVPRRAGRASGHLLLHRQPRRSVLRLRRASGEDLDLHHLHPRGPRWHRGGQVRRQLRGQPDRPAGGRRPRL